jgi:hypothetical protein
MRAPSRQAAENLSEEGGMNITTIHVYLSEEAVDCWYPVRAEHLGDDRYRILDEPPEDSILEFGKDDIVRCRLQKLGADVRRRAWPGHSKA